MSASIPKQCSVIIVLFDAVWSELLKETLKKPHIKTYVLGGGGGGGGVNSSNSVSSIREGGSFSVEDLVYVSKS
jgi:hypothetical protein